MIKSLSQNSFRDGGPKASRMALVLSVVLPTLVILCPSAHSEIPETFLIRADGVSPISFHASLLENQNTLAFSEWYLEWSIKRRPVQRFRQLFRSGHSEFLGGDLDKAQGSFLALTRLGETSLWTPTETRILFHTYFRLAQMTKNVEEQMSWIRKAILFAPAMVPDGTLIQPPLIAIWNRLSRQIPRQKWRIGATMPWVQRAVVNHESVVVDRDLRVEIFQNETNRVLLLSDQHHPIERILTGSEIQGWQPRPEVLLSGQCAAPVFHLPEPFGRSENFNVLGFFDTDCIVSNHSKRESALAPLPKLPDLPQTQNLSAATNESPLQNPPRTPMWRNVWLWAGIVGVTVMAVDQTLSQKNPGSSGASRPPTFKDGF